MAASLTKMYAEIETSIQFISSLVQNTQTEKLSLIEARTFLKSEMAAQKAMENDASPEFQFSEVFKQILNAMDQAVKEFSEVDDNGTNFSNLLSKAIGQTTVKFAINSQNYNQRWIGITFDFVSTTWAQYEYYRSGYLYYKGQESTGEFIDFLKIVQTPQNIFASNLLASENYRLAGITYLGMLLKERSLKPTGLSATKEKQMREIASNIGISMSATQEEFSSFVDAKEQEFIDKYDVRLSEFEERFDTIEKSVVRELGDKEKTFKQLQNTYRQDLSFEAPIKHWEEQAKKRASLAVLWSVFAALVTLVTIMLSSWFIDKLFLTEHQVTPTIPQYFVPIAFISILLYVVRQFVVIAVSSWHMSSEYSQKAALTTYFISMMKEGHMSEAEKQLILPELFAKIDTGLNKYQDNGLDVSQLISLVTKK